MKFALEYEQITYAKEACLIMDVSELNNLPSLVIKGEITREAAAGNVLEFIQKHPQIFGLNKYDEDFKSDIMIILLGKKERLLPLCCKNGKYELNTALYIGGEDFFYHIYWLVTSAINTKKRTLVKQKNRENAIYTDSKIQIKENEQKLSRLTPVTEVPKAPRNFKQISVEDFKKTFDQIIDNKCDKRLLVLAMKSSFYLTDEIIVKIAEHYKLNKDDFYEAIQFLKNSLDEKSQKRNYKAERRNRAYYYKLNYESQFEALKSGICEDEFQKKKLEEKIILHNAQWKKLNMQLKNGGPYVRPSNKMIANFLGICERQVSYYVASAKKEIEKKLNNEEITDFSEDSELTDL